MPTKTITIPTNYNGKLACGTFLHIDVAPHSPVRESLMESTDVLVKTADDSHPPVRCRLVDLCRQPMYELSSIVTYASHGMSRPDFEQWATTENPALSIVSKMCVYIYQKL